MDKIKARSNQRLRITIPQRDLNKIRESGLPLFQAALNGDKTMSFWCPYCLIEHQHGAPDGDDMPLILTLRSSHCTRPPLKAYWLFARANPR